MHFSFTVALAYVVALASANSVLFVNQDSTTRTIYFTQQAGLEGISPLVVAGNKEETQTFPLGWIGNFYSVSEGSPVVPGMLGELRWDGWNGINWFDVSAIVNSKDVNGVKTLAPKGAGTPTSGCQSYENGCNNAYYLPDDIQTKSTMEKDLICTLGTKASKHRRHGRDFGLSHGIH